MANALTESRRPRQGTQQTCVGIYGCDGGCCDDDDSGCIFGSHEAVCLPTESIDIVATLTVAIL